MNIICLLKDHEWYDISTHGYIVKKCKRCGLVKEFGLPPLSLLNKGETKT